MVKLELACCLQHIIKWKAYLKSLESALQCLLAQLAKRKLVRIVIHLAEVCRKELLVEDELHELFDLKRKLTFDFLLFNMNSF